MIKDFPQSSQPAWRLVGSELLAGAAIGLSYPLGLRHSHKRTPRLGGQRTVVLIHGYLANRSTFLLLSQYLRYRGVSQLLTFDYASTAGVVNSARALKGYLKTHVRGGKIDLVGHSLGGLVARVYLQDLGGARRVDRCVTLGTPHRGTYNAYWLASRVGRELRPDSAILARLESSKDNASRVRFTSIIGGSDNIVIPRIFAANEENIFLPDLGHLGMLFSHQAFKAVADCLVSNREP